MTKYTVVYERDEDGYWIADVPSIQGCHTYGRTLNEVKNRVREAIDACFDDSRIAANAELVDNIKLPSKAQAAVKKALSERLKLQKDAEQLHSTTEEAICLLVKDLGIGLRDVGQLLGLSHQRIHQICESRIHNSKLSRVSAKKPRAGKLLRKTK